MSRSGRILGVDFGGVIRSETQNAAGEYLPIVGAFDMLGLLKRNKIFDDIFIISRAGAKDRAAARLWLKEHRFYQRTGISMRNVHFCYERGDKAPLCQSLGVTHFIDNRTEVLAYLHEAGIQHLYLFGGQEEEMKPRLHLLEKFSTLESWEQVPRSVA